MKKEKRQELLAIVAGIIYAGNQIISQTKKSNGLTFNGPINSLETAIATAKKIVDTAESTYSSE